jgi:hypothetical protein
MKTNTVHNQNAPAVTGPVRTWLRLEALVVLAASVLLYQRFGGTWGLFAALFLAPDLAMLGYLVNARWGAHCYNAAHSYLTPLLLAAAAWLSTGAFPGPLLIWTAHIAFDRALGYGLKYPDAFGATHLGQLGRARAAAMRAAQES